MDFVMEEFAKDGASRNLGMGIKQVYVLIRKNEIQLHSLSLRNALYSLSSLTIFDRQHGVENL